MKNFLVFNTSFFGDTLLTGPLCQSLKLAYPESRLFFVVNKPFYEAACYLQGVDEAIAYDKKGRHKGISGAWQFYQEQKDSLPTIDAAFIIYGNERNIILAKLLGAKQIFADNDGLIRLCLANPKPDYGALRHVQDKNAFLSTFYTHAVFQSLPMCYLIPEQAIAAARSLLPQDGRKLVAVCTTTKKAAKDMRLEDCAELFAQLQQENKLPVLVGAGDTAAKYRDELRKLTSVSFVDLINRTGIAELAGVLKLCNYLISMDTGTLHLGLAVGTPTVAVYRLNSAAHLAAWAPLDMYKHRLVKGPDFSAAAMLRALRELEREALHD